ncbi:MAG: Ig-like domain-containing protein [Deltaproteobacteria bacterium]|nr:Ig-like domain-containing protein [Deltaproteobacteria bacterium]
MRKNFYLSGLFLCILALCICGCGSGGGSTADPMGTGTVRFIDDAGSIITSATVGVNGTITLRAYVSNTRSDGTVVPVVNEKVSFSIVNSGNGGSLVASSDRTGSDGTATCLFTSGSSMYSDNVRVTTSTGATASIYINKSGGLVQPSITKMEAKPEEVVAGQTSVVTVEVVDGGGNHVMGVPVTFTMPVNTSGAVFSYGGQTGAVYTTYTDSSGFATAVYKAGNNYATSEVFDSVMAELIGSDFYSSKAVNITRSAGVAPPAFTLTANPTSVPAGQTTIITATGAEGDVTYTIPVNASGGAFINSGGFAVNTITVPVGQTIVYRAGNLAPGTTVQDTVQGLLADGRSAVVIVTRTSAQPSIYTVDITATPTSVKAGDVSIINAKVTTTDTDGTDKAAPGVTVLFTLPVNSSGATLSAAAVMTDGTGNAIVIYRPGSNTATVQDTVQAAVGTAMDAVAITVTGSSTAAFRITVEAKPTTLATSTSNSVITANVKNNADEPISGVTVTFTATGGSLFPATATTDGNGNAVVTYTGSGVTGAHTNVVTASIAIGGYTYTNAAVITYPATVAGYGLALAANPATVPLGGTSVLTAAVSSADPSQTVSGRTVTFSIESVSVAGVTVTLSSASAVTDGTGKASVVFTRNLGPAASVLVKASSGGADAFVTITLNP